MCDVMHIIDYNKPAQFFCVVPVEVLTVVGFFSSPGLLSVLEAETDIVRKYASESIRSLHCLGY